MVSAVRPGGWLVIEAADFGAVMGAATARYLDPPDHAAEFERSLSAAAALLAAAGGDGSFGGRLIGALKDARSASRATTSSTYRQAVVLPTPNPAASSANVSPFRR